MIREYVEGKKFNGQVKSKMPTAPHSTVWFVRGVIKIDGVNEAFSGKGKSLGEAQRMFNSYLEKDCICCHGSDIEKCPVHRRVD